MKRYAIVIMVSLIMLTGCSSAGPFVTSISSDGRGNLSIEKAKVHLNPFTGVISTTETMSMNIKVIPKAAEKEE